MPLVSLDFYNGQLALVPPMPGGREFLRPGEAWLRRAVDKGAVAMPSHPAGWEHLDGKFSIIVTVVDGLLRLEVLRPPPKGMDRNRGEPVGTFWVSGRASAGAKAWTQIVRDYGGLAGLKRPAGPWVTSAVHTGGSSGLDATGQRKLSEWVAGQAGYFAEVWVALEREHLARASNAPAYA